MSRKLIISAVTGVAALGLTTAALANGGSFVPAPGPAPAPQSESSFYIGASAGWGDTHWDNLYDNSQTYVDGMGGTFKVTGDSKDTGFAGRAYIGYNFNKYLAVEGGWTYLPKSKVNVWVGNTSNVVVPPADLGDGTFKIENYAFDLVGKITAPLGDGLAVYAKGGVNYFQSKIKSTSGVATGATFSSGKTKVSHWGPVVGFGASYEVMTNLKLHVDWMRFSGQGKLQPNLVQTVGMPATLFVHKDYQPNPDVIMGGLTYSFPIGLG